MSYSDRYEALGMAHPDAATVCRGQCEGTGVYPLTIYNEDVRYRTGMLIVTPGFGLEPTAAECNAWVDAHWARCRGWGRVRRLGLALRTGIEYAFAPRNEGIRENNGGRWGAFVCGWNSEIRCDGWHFITCPTCGGTGKR